MPPAGGPGRGRGGSLDIGWRIAVGIRPLLRLAQHQLLRLAHAHACERIERGVLHLRGEQRPARPVAPLRLLGQRMAEEGLASAAQRGVGIMRADAKGDGRWLHVEHAPVWHSYG